MEADLRVLRNSKLLRMLPQTVLCRQVLPHGRRAVYSKGQMLIEPGDCVDRFGILVSGSVHIMHIFSDGTCSLMSVLTAGEVTGADLICTRSRISPYHAVAGTAAEVLWFPARLLTEQGLLEENCRLQVLGSLLQLVSHENMKKEYRLAILSRRGLRERIVTYLSMQAARQGTLTFTIPFSREELAAFLCVNRSALSHELGLMRKEGLLEVRKNQFTLKNFRVE